MARTMRCIGRTMSGPTNSGYSSTETT
ncbi:hypothetical protein CGCTS75_v008085 [Colletotrichum tropicale]|nr:hypothetical protein CGCTS75_v008085 [Colletotrichum tropicale]